MGWLRRGNQIYFYKYVRRGGRVRAIYCGRGPAAELAMLDIQERRAADREAAALRQQVEAEHRMLVQPLIHFGRQMDLLVHAVLVCSGFYQHHHGEWRRRKQRGEEKSIPAANAATRDATGYIDVAR
ncbi:MAG TPA: hypothetical protein VMP01_27190 [Pirellulaceae bacterium]|nr:hypothetical protein [Pirellulaceae bacterium]